MTDPISLAQQLNYRVQPGDTLGAIAKRFGIPADEIAKASGLANPDRIGAGQDLNVPQFPVNTYPAGYVVNQDAPGNWEMPTYRGPTGVPPPSPVSSPAPEPEGASALAQALLKAHEYIDPTRYLGGTLGTALAGLPAGKAVEGAAALASRLGEAPAAEVADAAFTPSQWSRMAGSNMRETLAPTERGFANVADDAAVAANPETVIHPLPEPTPGPGLTQELRAIHRQALKQMPRPARGVKPLQGEALAKRRAYYKQVARNRKVAAKLTDELPPTAFDDPLYFNGQRAFGKTLPQ